MIASFIPSRTLAPTMAAWLLGNQVAAHGHEHSGLPGFFNRFQRRFERGVSHFRSRYREVLVLAVMNRRTFVPVFMLCAIASMVLAVFLGRDFFPGIKSGEIDLHMRAPIGMRFEDASEQAVRVNNTIRALLRGKGPNVLENRGLPAFSHAHREK